MFNDNETIWLRCRCQNKNNCKRCLGRGYYADPRYLQRFYKENALPAQSELVSIAHSVSNIERRNALNNIQMDTEQIYNDAILKLTKNKGDLNVVMTVL